MAMNERRRFVCFALPPASIADVGFALAVCKLQ